MNKFPIRLPQNLNLELTQGFRAPIPVDISVALSKQTTDHLGVDVTCGTSAQTWGQECVWPFPWPGIVYDAQVDAPLGATQHAHSQIDGTDPATGIKYSLIYIHLSAVTRTVLPGTTTAVTYNQGETIGRIGNNGFVNPPPTPELPLNGSHLHLGLGVKKPGELNSTMVDPLLYLDLEDPYRTSVQSYQFNVNLAFKQQGVDIQNLQRVLQKLGFFPIGTAITGYYGPVTASAILQFRVQYGVSSANDPFGHSVGPLTRSALNKL